MNTTVLDGELIHGDETFFACLSPTCLSLTRLGVSKEPSIYIDLLDLLGASLDTHRESFFYVEKLPTLDLFLNRNEVYSFVGELEFMCCNTPNAAGLVATAQDWVGAITHALRGQPYQRGQVVVPRRYKVIINPVAGNGNSVEIARFLRPLMQRAGIVLDTTITLMPGHARDIARVFSPVLNEAVPPLPQIVHDAIVIIGGDETVFEVMNGLLGRRDWPRAVQVPMIIIPNGKTNAIALALGFDNLTTAVYSMIKGQYRKIDMLAIERCKQRVFLPTMLSWGAITSVPANNNALSTLLQFSSQSRQYSGKVYYREVTNAKEAAPIVVSKESEEAAAMPARDPSSDTPDALHKAVQHDGNFDYLADQELRAAHTATLSPEEDERDETLSRNGNYGPVTPKLTEADLSTSPAWKSVTGTFAALLVSNLPCTTSGLKLTPNASPFDGMLDLFILKDPTQLQLTKLMYALTVGANPTSAPPNVIACKVDAVAIVPAFETQKTQPPQLALLPGADYSEEDCGPAASRMIAAFLLPHLMAIQHKPYERRFV